LNLEPENPTILSNLSAVHFEMGKYEDAADFAVKALALSADQPDEKKDRLNVRLAKSYLYGLDTAAADEILGHLGSEQEALADAIRDTARLRTVDGMLPSSASWTRLFDRMPRYKPCL
jgi:tetratricopeptide (TPR) repeat protein